MSDQLTIARLVHYPIKGMAGLTAANVELTAGEGMPLDRIYAVENGSHRFEARNPKWFAKTHFLQLMRNERLAGLAQTFDEESHTLTLFCDGKQVAKGSLKTKLGRHLIEQFLSAYMKTDRKGTAAHRFRRRPSLHGHRRKGPALRQYGDRSGGEPGDGARSRSVALSRQCLFRRGAPRGRSETGSGKQ